MFRNPGQTANCNKRNVFYWRLQFSLFGQRLFLCQKYSPSRKHCTPKADDIITMNHLKLKNFGNCINLVWFAFVQKMT